LKINQAKKKKQLKSIKVKIIHSYFLLNMPSLLFFFQIYNVSVKLLVNLETVQVSSSQCD